jgi:hypothetical protein
MRDPFYKYDTLSEEEEALVIKSRLSPMSDLHPRNWTAEQRRQATRRLKAEEAREAARKEREAK